MLFERGDDEITFLQLTKGFDIARFVRPITCVILGSNAGIQIYVLSLAVNPHPAAEVLERSRSHSRPTGLRAWLVHRQTHRAGLAHPRLNLLVFTTPETSRTPVKEFVEFYNYRRYHHGIGNMTPADVYFAR
jgi:hypothetical protein